MALPSVSPPNESRLSCGAKLECSQTEFYNTAGRTFTGLIEERRRQLQAHVRLRTTSHSSGPFPSGSTGSTHRPLPLHSDRDAGWTAARSSPAAPRPAHNGTFTWVAPSDRTEPARRMPAATLRPTRLVFTKRIALSWDAQPNSD